MESGAKYVSCNINKFDMMISTSFMDCRIFWARVVSSESESLFTKYQKHSFFEIQYALQGKIGMLLEDESTVTSAESEFLIVPPDTFHQIVESDVCGARFIMAFLPEFKDPLLETAAVALKEVRPYPESPHMRNLLSMILQKEYHNEPVRKESITALVECFLMEVMETVLGTLEPRAHPHPLSKTAAEVQKMLAFIHDYNGIGISAAGIAAHFMISERQLTRMFVAVTGAGPSAAIAAEKLKKIEELVTSTPLSFAEIAEICGFSDGYAMNKFFKRHNHVTPSEYRAISGKKQ